MDRFTENSIRLVASVQDREADRDMFIQIWEVRDRGGSINTVVTRAAWDDVDFLYPERDAGIDVADHDNLSLHSIVGYALADGLVVGDGEELELTNDIIALGLSEHFIFYYEPPSEG